MSTSHILVTVIAMILSLTGCSTKNQKNDFVSKSLQEIAAPQTTQTTKHQVNPTSNQTIHPVNQLQSPIGIVIDHDRIIIDTRQAKNFLEELAKKVDSGFKKIEQDLRKGQIHSPNDTGIVVTPHHIEVDLNKTEIFMGKWIKSMESVGQELDNVFRELDRSLNP